MESQKLYRVKEGDLDKLIRILTVCFAEDPLYQALIRQRYKGTADAGTVYL